MTSTHKKEPDSFPLHPVLLLPIIEYAGNLSTLYLPYFRQCPGMSSDVILSPIVIPTYSH